MCYPYSRGGRLAPKDIPTPNDRNLYQTTDCTKFVDVNTNNYLPGINYTKSNNELALRNSPVRGNDQKSNNFDWQTWLILTFMFIGIFSVLGGVGYYVFHDLTRSKAYDLKNNEASQISKSSNTGNTISSGSPSNYQPEEDKDKIVVVTSNPNGSVVSESPSYDNTQQPLDSDGSQDGTSEGSSGNSSGGLIVED